jgi:transcriptional regulator with XRE-family HTH domain
MEGTMFELLDDQDRARVIGQRMRERRERDGLSLTRVARETGVSGSTIKRFEDVAANDAPGKPFRYEPWGAEYLERWLDGTFTPEVRTLHDFQRVLERDPGLSRDQVRAILPEIYAIYQRVRNGEG